MDFKPGEEVLARWTDCRYYPAKIEAMSPEGTYTVQFYDGVIRCLKKMHIKCMPDDARGQDWIALVKAAAAAVGIKSKAGGKPRTSANSNKDKEDKKSLKVSLLNEETSISETLEEVIKKEEAPTSSGVMDVPVPVEDGPVVDVPVPDVPVPDVPVEDVPVVAVPNVKLVETETPISVKRKSNEGSTFQAKRARLNKITGLLASKAVVVEDAVRNDSEKTAPTVGQSLSATLENQKNFKAVSNCATTRKPSLMPTTLSSKKVRSRKAKYESGVSLASKVQSPLPALTTPLVQSLEPMRVPPLPPTVIKETCEHRLFQN